jgi:hypothetical protein
MAIFPAHVLINILAFCLYFLALPLSLSDSVTKKNRGRLLLL